MKRLNIDIETYSEADLMKSGVYRYSDDPGFEVLLFGYSEDGGPVRVVDLANGEQLPEKIKKALMDDALETDDREGLVREYLEKLLPENWNKMSLSERRMFLSGDEFTSQGNAGTVPRERVCNLEIWAECFGRDPASIKRQDSYELSTMMAKIEGWKRYDGNKSGKLSFAEYGPQVAFVREAIEKEEDALPF